MKEWIFAIITLAAASNIDNLQQFQVYQSKDDDYNSDAEKLRAAYDRLRKDQEMQN